MPAAVENIFITGPTSVGKRYIAIAAALIWTA